MEKSKKSKKKKKTHTHNVQRKSEHKIVFPANDENAFKTFLHSCDDMAFVQKDNPFEDHTHS